MRQWKNFENRLIFGEVMDSDKVGRFLGHSVYVVSLSLYVQIGAYHNAY